MKKLWTLAGVVLFAQSMAACGGSSNVCDKAGNIMEDAMDEACQSYGDSCCFCKCWNDGHKTVADATNCTCKEPDDTGSGGDCSGQAKAQAQQCVDDSDACKQSVKQSVDMACGGGMGG